MSRKTLTLATVSLFGITACDSSPTGPDGNGFDTVDLTAQLAVSPHHFHIWETTGTFTVTVVDPAGGAVTDFEVIRVEHRMVGTSVWRTFSLTQDGAFYVGTYVFESPGDYQLRVTGIRPMDQEMTILYEAPTPLEVVRAHANRGDFRIDFEAVPGHIHAGESATLNFWFAPAGVDHHVSPALATGLAPTILIDTGGSEGVYTAEESESGRYTATHVFAATSDSLPVTVRFTSQGTEYEYTVNIKIHAAH